MSKNSKGFCSACLRDQLRCNRGKPKCDKCNERGTKCSYSFKLKWGGRQYKDMNRSAGIPNTKFYKGALLVKNKRLIAGKSTQKVRQFLPFGQEESKLSAFFDEGYKYTEEQPQLRQQQQPEEAPIVDNKTLIPPASLCEEVIPLLQTVPTYVAPGLVGLEFDDSSWEFSTFFNLFINETSRFFVAFHSQAFPNPFHTVLPQMALSCPTLMKLIIAFGAKHRRMIAMVDEGANYPSLEENGCTSVDFGYMGENLLNQALNELVKKLQNSGGRADDSTMAIILLLSSLGIFFNDDRVNWRTHYNGAKRIVFNELEIDQKSEEPIIYYQKDSPPHFFVMRWFIYLDVVGPLSSGFFHSRSEEVPRPHFNFNLFYGEKFDKSSIESLEDICPLNGMDMKLLSYLTRVSQLILKKKAVSVDQNDHFETVGKAICLDYKISNHLRESEAERDLVVKRLKTLSDPSMEKRLERYDIIRSTNLLFGLTGILQLRRRIVEMSQASELVTQLVQKITDLIREKITVNSPSLSCLSFCFFTVGCELVDESMSIHRSVYRDRLMSLWKRGVPSVLQAVNVMEECWRLKKPWWVILEEKNLDICLAF
ncbi:ZYRO0C18414p [Zygosaccharomyces rouxii]|uniref:ZYRO0C18414p n=1 Tax=Zygosaccharomyces rouxii (strain ATCC 2623 / CBS 732 / NBRC 1130 / NCYC 568 / NRRL Y-229) TaxID=559307 RepID=C5DUN9_ZYGRC|nr:uncharacterized protein ZYRO0C18414g [Zygosaccharomyces rouxii]KAH9199713.1 fungal-specific transcription factor domain-containing protein [Zygosaccharomyces rouxii]CAR27500.1 ZYRO0C18414p [Zygosaccharomyces rouxii]